MSDDQPQDEIARILAEDPHAHVVEGGDEVWLLTGDQTKMAREALADEALAEGEPDS